MPILLPTPAEALGTGSSEQIVKGTGVQIPSGIAGLISYNSLVMNNREWYDTIIINKIDGLGDPDVRDERENNPQRDGETPFDSFYGGRTLVLNGYIRAFNYDKMMDLWTALTTAFLPLTENSLQFHGKNLVTTSQIWCKKSASITKSDEQVRDDLFRRDFMITLRASLPAFLSMDQSFVFMTMGDIDTFDINSLANYEGMTTIKVEGGVLVPTSSTTRVINLKTAITDYVYPRVSLDYKAETSFVGGVVGAQLKKLDAGNYLRARISAGGVAELARVDETVVTGLGAPTMTKGSSTVTRSLGTFYRTVFKIEGEKVWFEHGPATGEPDSIGYWILAGAQVLKYVNNIRAKSWIEIINPNTLYRWDNFIFSSAQPIGESVMKLVVNRGNYEALPKIQITGPITGPVVQNLSTGQELILEPSTVIPAGATWTIDIAAGTLVDQNGVNQFNSLAPQSDWMVIGAGNNDIRLLGSQAGTQLNGSNQRQTALAIYHRHSWF